VKRILVAALLIAVSFRAHAIGHLADVSIYDRDSGEILPIHFHRGEYWVAGTPGARYAVAIRNRSNERILAVTAIDGVNVICGDTASWSQTGYVLGPWASYQIDGWRKSDAEVANFLFANASASYATLTGRPANIGVIGVALFRERETPIAMSGRMVPLQAESLSRRSSAATEAPPPAPSPTQPSLTANASALPAPRAITAPMVEKLGTGHGQREESHVVQTDFERQQNSPNEVVQIRYDSLPNLIALGVIRPTQNPNIVPSAFPDSPLAQYVPDPQGIR
jgi:hypothetical protein